PVALSFNGVAHFEQKDEAAHKATVKAQGTDAKGRGGANALVHFALEPAPTGTKVNIETDVDLSGSIAQYGRGVGMIQSVATQLISQFAKALEQKIAGSQTTAAAAPAAGSGTSSTSAAAPASAAAASPPPAAKPISGF